MMATWFQGPADEFIRVSREGWERGVSILHFLGGNSIDLAGDARRRADQDDHLAAGGGAWRARRTSSAPAASTISSRSAATAGAWFCASRSTRRTASIRVAPGAGLVLERGGATQFPDGYRHLAYRADEIGYQVKRDMPGLKGPEVEALYRRGMPWLAGGPAT